jgi:hypothetical protein
MSISYPNSVTVINNITSSGGGGSGDATSIVGYPIITGTLANNHFIIYDSFAQQWKNIQYKGDYSISLLATPTNASGTIQQELTRFCIPSELGNIEAFCFASYKLDGNETGSFVISGSVEGIVASELVSGGTEVGSILLQGVSLTGSNPYYLVASSSNTASDFKIYNASITFAGP